VALMGSADEQVLPRTCAGSDRASEAHAEAACASANSSAHDATKPMRSISAAFSSSPPRPRPSSASAAGIRRLDPLDVGAQRADDQQHAQHRHRRRHAQGRKFGAAPA
jgi:hypothetical protein